MVVRVNNYWVLIGFSLPFFLKMSLFCAVDCLMIISYYTNSKIIQQNLSFLIRFTMYKVFVWTFFPLIFLFAFHSTIYKGKRAAHSSVLRS